MQNGDFSDKHSKLFSLYSSITVNYGKLIPIAIGLTKSWKGVPEAIVSPVLGGGVGGVFF